MRRAAPSSHSAFRNVAMQWNENVNWRSLDNKISRLEAHAGLYQFDAVRGSGSQQMGLRVRPHPQSGTGEDESAE